MPDISRGADLPPITGVLNLVVDLQSLLADQPPASDATVDAEVGATEGTAD